MSLPVACIIVFVVSYLLGSISWGLVISRVFYHVDLREHGSGNIGATNAVRVLGKVGYVVFVLDFVKGVLSGLSAKIVSGYVVSGSGLTAWEIEAMLLGISLLACMWGHVFNPWLRFKGGKGIAVAGGCLLMVFGIWGCLAEIAIFGIVALSTRYISAGSISAAVLCPFISLFMYIIQAPAGSSPSWVNFICCLIAAATAIWAHRGNIQRLRSGTENRMGSKKDRVTKQ
ncbi:MAG: glycerol-3-phosphate 1-O-acyltransferase PlsY [Eggerthellaceae bacterium]|nr:glycerol-3-phosphate 1-O-acyltransferase PlsY [Eggerthellaceae bacterium]